MGRLAVVLAHVLSSLAAAALYFLFALPRWWELTGSVSPAWGTALRIVTGLVVALAAVPVLVDLRRSRRPEFGTPQLALTLRAASIAGHIVAGVLIIGTAISEIWLSIDDVGQWLFGVYGAAAAIAVLGFAAFYLSLLAELPPPPPKPIKPKAPRRRRKARKAEADGAAAVDDHEVTESSGVELDATAPAEDTAAADDEDSAADDDTAAVGDTAAGDKDQQDDETGSSVPADAESSTPASSGALRNRRPSGKAARRRRRTRGGVTAEDSAD